jgi:hypothetical protein
MELSLGVGSSNLIAFMRAECDVHSTYEGDNTVLMISVSNRGRNEFLDILLTSSCEGPLGFFRLQELFMRPKSHL